MPLKYRSQAVAKPYFVGAILLFFIQILSGLVVGLQYVIGDFLFPEVPFNAARMVHSNAMVMWLLLGFMGSACYIVPEEAETELFAPWLARLVFLLFFAIAIATTVAYLFLPYAELVTVTKNELLPTMGRKYLEQPTIIKGGIIILGLLFLLNVWATTLKGRKSAINAVLLFGLLGTILLLTLAFYNPSDLILDKFYWWWLIHLWVSAFWELVLTAILAFVLLKTTGVSREIIEKWLYLIAAMIFITGLVGTGQHYYWIGTPVYWQWWGAMFAALEPIPLFMLIVFAFEMVNQRQHHHPNRAAMLWATGTAVLAFVGAGLWDFLHNFPFINFYTHGTQIVVANSHMAFYGTYVLVNLTMISYAMPILRGRKANDVRAQTLEMWSFWLMSASMVAMGIFITIAGVLQVYLQRYTDTPLPFMVVQERITFFYWLREAAGVLFLLGFLTYMVSFFVKSVAPNKTGNFQHRFNGH